VPQLVRGGIHSRESDGRIRAEVEVLNREISAESLAASQRANRAREALGISSTASPPRLVIVGSGYVGLVTGACLASVGVDVVCVDVDPARVADIAAGRAPFYEPELDGLLASVAGRRLTATVSIEEAAVGANLFMISVGTPSPDGQIDLAMIRTAGEAIAKVLSRAATFPVVVVKSTVIPGTTRDVILPLLERASGLEAGRDFGVAVNPEFLTEGAAVADFLHPDRVVVGAEDARSSAIVAALYAGFDVPVIHTNSATAEMIKYASNTLLSTLISLSNEIANLGSAVGDVDATEVMRGVHASRYLTVDDGEGKRHTAPIAAYLKAGSGYGGSCLPKDTQALVSLGRRLGRPMPLLEAVEAVNAAQPGVLADLIEQVLGGLAGARIGVLGLAFKPHTDDVRESPAFPVIRALVARGATVAAHDPVAIEPARKALAGVAIRYEPDLGRLVGDVDVLVLVTDWADYECLPDLLAGLPEPPIVVDGRRSLAPESVPRYAGIGH
jgi:UDPglucose 6-dehydrogenase